MWWKMESGRLCKDREDNIVMIGRKVLKTIKNLLHKFEEEDIIYL